MVLSWLDEHILASHKYTKSVYVFLESGRVHGMCFLYFKIRNINLSDNTELFPNHSHCFRNTTSSLSSVKISTIWMVLHLQGFPKNRRDFWSTILVKGETMFLNFKDLYNCFKFFL
jgi:hypothetical protein